MRERLTTLGIVTGLLVCASVAIGALRVGVPVSDPWLFPILVVLPALAVIGFGLTLFASPSRRTNVLLLATTVVLTLYAGEAVLRLSDEKPPPRRDQVARARGEPFDTRSQHQVVLDMRAAGFEVYPTVSGSSLRDTGPRGGLDLEFDGRRVIPMSNVRNRTVVHCNEAGEYSVFQTDERGFNNPAGSWADPVDVVALGDSFIHGACVDTALTLVANIRRHIPRTLGVGLDAYGPLFMLGALEEYVTSVRPRDVLWFYFEWNDLRELHEELQFEPLRQYLDPWSSQQLDQRAGEIDLALLAFLDGQITRYQGRRGAVAPGTRIPSRPFVEWARLQRLRKALALDGIRNRLDLCCDLETFEAVLNEAKRNVESWGGRLHFVYLPAAPRYHRPMSAVLDETLRARARVLRIAHRVGLPVVDVHAAFQEEGNPGSFFVDARSHYNATGYEVAAEAVVKHLKGFPNARGDVARLRDPATSDQ
jgi:hypothetical protein